MSDQFGQKKLDLARVTGFWEPEIQAILQAYEELSDRRGKLERFWLWIRRRKEEAFTSGTYMDDGTAEFSYRTSSSRAEIKWTIENDDNWRILLRFTCRVPKQLLRLFEKEFKRFRFIPTLDMAGGYMVLSSRPRDANS